MHNTRLNYPILLLLVIFSLTITTNVLAGKKLVGNWDSTPALDASWGNVGGNDHRTYIESGELHQIVRPYCKEFDGIDCGMTARTRFLGPEYNSLIHFQSTLRLENKCDIATNNEFDFCGADFSGFFYNKNVSPSDAAGDVFFIIRFGDKGSGLEAWWEIWEVQDADYIVWNLFAGETIDPPSGGWQMSTDYTVDVVYDNVKTFAGTFGPQAIVGAVGPDKGDSAFYAGKWIRVRAELNQALTDVPDTNIIHAVYDDISIDTGSGLTLHDDFNSGSLSTSLWDSGRLLRDVTVVNNRLKMSYKTADTDIISNNGVSLRAGLPEMYETTKYLQADMEIVDGVTPDGTRSEVLLEGGFGNGKYTTENFPGNSDGEIFAAVRLRKRSDAPYAYDTACWVIMCQDANCTSYIDYIWNNAFAPINPDTKYTASLQKSGTVFSCNVRETSTGSVLVSSSTDLALQGLSNIYPVNEFKQLRVRVREAPGEVLGYFDNLVVEVPSSILLNIVPIISNVKE